MNNIQWRLLAVCAPLLVMTRTGGHSTPTRAVEVTVTEGTSMAVAVSPDGSTLAIDLQGSVWTLPASGGRARRLTDEYSDARQPTFSPNGRVILYHSFREGTYDIRAMNADGTGDREITGGVFDDREAAWSPDGRQFAFASDRSGNYDIWIHDWVSGDYTQITSDAGEDYMPSWSPDGREIAFVGTRGGVHGVYAIRLDNRAERTLTVVQGGRVDAPSWGPGGGDIVYHVTGSGGSRLEMAGRSLTGGENAFAFRASWRGRDIHYVSDGKIRKRSTEAATGALSTTIEFTATLVVNPASYTRRTRDLDSRSPRKALGIVGPVISPDGSRVAFVALGDLFVAPVAGGGGRPVNLTNDRFLDAEPAWSRDGRYLAWSSDRGGSLLDIWVRDMTTGESRQLTNLSTSAMSPAWSPDGGRIAFLDVDGIWRRASVSVVDVETGKVTRVRESMFGPGAPTWSADGRRIAVAALVPNSTRFREGWNQVLTFPSGSDVSDTATMWFTPQRRTSIDSRVGAGPVWSPDGTRMIAVYGGGLSVFNWTGKGEPDEYPRPLTRETAHAPSWTADGRSVLYQSNDRLRLMEVATGNVRDVPVELTFTPAIPQGAGMVVHAGRLFDGQSSTLRSDIDIIVRANRIVRVERHASGNHSGVPVVDASGLTVMPGLIEYHTHIQKDLGEAAMRAYLAWGVTSVRSPGGTPYEAVEDREAIEAGVRAGPRLFVTGYLLEWQRTYYKMAVAVADDRHLERELERAKALGHDMIKSYVRMPDLRQKRIIEFAHAAGVPASSHEVYPAFLSGVDATEHTSGTSRRGYSPKVATLGRSYSDVSSLFGAAGVTFTPTLALGGGGLRRLVENDSTLRTDPRFRLYPGWLSAQVTAIGGGRAQAPAAAGGAGTAAGGEMVMALARSGTKVVAGTDTPNAAALHGELYSYVLAGMTPFEALRTATVNAAEALGIDAGVVAPGKLADLIIIDGNPITDITTTTRVRHVIANGRHFGLAELVGGR
ncbi:MAG: amidohydrolase family protein [Gemmatimonadota bacterium]